MCNGVLSCWVIQARNVTSKEINPLLNISINTDISSSNNSIDLNNLFINYLNSELNGYFHVDHFSNSDLTNYVFEKKEEEEDSLKLNIFFFPAAS